VTILERRLIDTLKLLRDEYGVDGVKAEFEAEGTRTEELMRLKEIALYADVFFTLKIGGCEAIRDIYDAKSVGVDNIVGPMIESPFALKKFIDSVETVFSPEERDEVDCLINVETIGTINGIEELYNCPAFPRIDGIVLGRGDLVESLGLPRSAVDCDECFTHSRAAISSAKEKGKTTVMGGSITAASIDFIRRLPAENLDRYETRKICFKTNEALHKDPEKGIAVALDFELLWLENKRNHYSAISEEDSARIESLTNRMKRT
jgi:hypothetical protein